MYKPGWIGTWLSWFINQHSTFPNYQMKLNYDDRNDSSIATDFVCKGGSWFEREGHSLSQSMLSASERASIINFNATQRCYKTFPHDYPNDCNEVDDFIIKIKESNIEYNVIIPTLINDSHIKILAKRFVDIIELDDGEEIPSYQEMLTEFIDTARNKTYYSKIENVANSVHYVDIGSLMFDRNNTGEQVYSSLLEYINDKPIDNWKSHVEYAIEKVFNRYMD